MTYQIFVRNTHNGGTMAIDVKEDYTLLDIKKMISGRNGSPTERQRIIFGGKELTDNDNKTISDLGITKETTLQLIYKRPKMPKHPKKFFGGSLNDFILERIDYDTPNSKSVVVIGGCGEANRGGRDSCS